MSLILKLHTWSSQQQKLDYRKVYTNCTFSCRLADAMPSNKHALSQACCCEVNLLHLATGDQILCINS